ncbi:protein OXIDATIVE STRESS 3 LIKE 1-like [Mercurialis annua]|uniref:protein OXIDATIVE STRESS 3 LIKE 1-like n=1 Tax=Mercurialis annua TaxID=3986 RepID=UPI00215F795B|nr:protein OXIDATIVE STRESS 3 LIKE 1-like [Mercurialis annua]
MSIALESSINRGGMADVKPRGIACVASAAMFESPAERTADVNECSSSSADSSTTSSSVGKNSDVSSSSNGDDCEEENEVQSAFKGSFDAMDSLEEALPIRKGISKFYNGKSKSFTSLAEASSSCCIKEIAKPENAYTRKRRNLLAFSHGWEKNRSFPYRSNGGGISKRSISTSKSTLALAVAMSSSESITSTSDDSTSSSISKSPPHLPPLHPRARSSTYHNNLALLPSLQQNSSPWRSFSVADLQQSATASNRTDR